jgi:hypothetical protein
MRVRDNRDGTYSITTYPEYRFNNRRKVELIIELINFDAPFVVVARLIETWGEDIEGYWNIV